MPDHYVQPSLALDFSEPVTGGLSSVNAVQAKDRAFHDWYRFVLSFPPHLVRHYLQDFNLTFGNLVLDPFCGTGTTLVEAKLNGIAGVGIETNPFPHFASTVKTTWEINPNELQSVALEIADAVYDELENQGVDDKSLQCRSDVRLKSLEPERQRALITDSISPLPLHKSLVLLEHLHQHEDAPYYGHMLLALGNALVNSISNLRFGPEVGIGKQKKDAHVIGPWLSAVGKMVRDLEQVHDTAYPDAQVHLGDARQVSKMVAAGTIDAVITSPPYPNEKDYSRTTRLESVVLGFFTDMSQLRSYKKTFIRSNTRGVYKSDDDDQWVAHNREIQQLSEAIERRRKELGKTSGFERLYARVTRLYFGGMARHLADLRTVLRPGAQLAYVVGDQASYLQIMIRTGKLLAAIAEDLGYQVERIDLFRTRFATATQSELREEVLVLRWPG